MSAFYLRISRCDAASTHAHMRVLLELLNSQEKISPGKSTIWEHTTAGNT